MQKEKESFFLLVVLCLEKRQESGVAGGVFPPMQKCCCHLLTGLFRLEYPFQRWGVAARSDLICSICGGDEGGDSWVALPGWIWWNLLKEDDGSGGAYLSSLRVRVRVRFAAIVC
ncbi:hypothetical protein ACHQM5_015783 [Ranunculus cassubicifolius]